MIFIQSMTEKLVGKEFEIECYDIEVHGFDDHCPPLFKGPGVISGKEKGAIEFKIYNQIDIPFDKLRLFFNQNNDEEILQVRIFAKDYDNNDWTGGWAIPHVNLSTSGKLIVSGEFDQLSTLIRKIKGDENINSTELVFPNIIDLPFDGLVEEKVFHLGEEILSRTYYDRHEVKLNNSKINFYRNSSNGLFHIIANNSQGFNPPFAENWIPEALTVVTASRVYPRMVIRHFEENAMIFLRNQPFETKSNMPRAILRSSRLENGLWGIFKTYLNECIINQEFEQLVTTKIFSEVIIASTGTIQAFVLSMSVCVENLASQLASEFSIKTIDKSVLKSLRNHLENWQGEEDIKKRTVGLLSMLGTKSTTQILKALKEEGVIEDRHIKAWKEIRNSLAHGGIIEFPINDDFWLKRNLLISMVYRLIFRKIGYKGSLTDHADPDAKSINFQWSDNLRKKRFFRRKTKRKNYNKSRKFRVFRSY
jgi:hypothetical protein